MTAEQDPGGFGCRAFGHLVSPFVDGELPREEAGPFATHLDACRPCHRLVGEYRALDNAARRPAAPGVTAVEWEAAWTGIRAALEADRRAAEGAPLAGVTRIADRLSGRVAAGRWTRPLGYAAAAAVLVALTLSLERSMDGPSGQPVGVASEGPRPVSRVAALALAPVTSITCQSPEFVPVMYTVDGDDPLTVVQCAWIGDVAEQG